MGDVSNSDKLGATRRGMMAGAAALAPISAMVAGGANAATPNRTALQHAVENGKETAVQRIRDWIAHPTIAAEHRNVPEGAQYMQQLARDAGFGSSGGKRRSKTISTSASGRSFFFTRSLSFCSMPS